MTELDVFQRIRDKPGMFIGVKSITALASFVSGFNAGATQAGLSIPKDTSQAMGEFIRKRYDIRGKYSWSRVLLMVCGSEEAAYDKFYELLDRHLAGEAPIDWDANHDDS